MLFTLWKDERTKFACLAIWQAGWAEQTLVNFSFTGVHSVAVTALVPILKWWNKPCFEDLCHQVLEYA